MIILAIDPGTSISASVLYQFDETQPTPQGFIRGHILEQHRQTNNTLLDRIRTCPVLCNLAVIEQVESYGMPVGQTIFETVHWAGRYYEALDTRQIPIQRLTRGEVKLHLCGTKKAKDSNIRQALIDRFGHNATRYVVKDMWAALAVAVTFADTIQRYLKVTLTTGEQQCEVSI